MFELHEEGAVDVQLRTQNRPQVSRGGFNNAGKETGAAGAATGNGAHLVGALRDDDEQVEVRPDRKRRVVVPLFLGPLAVLQAVQHHVMRVTIVAWVDVKSDVSAVPGSALQVHVESGGARKQR